MARPRKYRRVCCIPEKKWFGPLGAKIEIENVIIMCVEEYEVIRLMDWVGLTQEECAQRMGVARTSVQRLYNDARKKMADSFINSKLIKVEGGNFTECTGENPNCCGKGCVKRHL